MFCFVAATLVTPQSREACRRFDLPSDSRLLSRHIKRPQQPILRFDYRRTWPASRDLSLDAPEFGGTPRRRRFSDDGFIDYRKRILKPTGSC